MSWLTAMLVATGTHDPKKFPRSPGEVLKKPDEPLSPRQWDAMLKMLHGGNTEKPKKKNPK